MRHPIISMKEQKPQREVEGVVPRLLPATDPLPVAKVRLCSN
jgi:hypothetical protein